MKSVSVPDPDDTKLTTIASLSFHKVSFAGKKVHRSLKASNFLLGGLLGFSLLV